MLTVEQVFEKMLRIPEMITYETAAKATDLLADIGFEFAGKGHYSIVLGHADHPDKVFKLSGPSGWPYGTKSGTRTDPWQTYAKACMQLQEQGAWDEHLPKIFCMQQEGDFVLASMERLEPLHYAKRHGACASDYEAKYTELQAEFRNSWYNLDPDQDQTARFYQVIQTMRQEAGSDGCQKMTPDLHSANVMVRPGTLSIVVTDPLS